jgi:methylated-DNA-[protein]-cysteine S-methyltransferase
MQATVMNMPKLNSANSYVYKVMKSPVGALKLVGSDRGLAAVLWENDDPGRVRLNIAAEDQAHPVLVEAERQLNEYFAGKRKKFSVELDFAGTVFQTKVWRTLLAIPFGETRSYGDIARELGKPTAVRAVGAANGRNPISIIAPCHRVVGATGALTGFAGGLKTKAYLLKLEGGRPETGPHGKARSRRGGGVRPSRSR